MGTWTGGDFVTLISGQSCSVSSGYIYCVGGFELPEGAGEFTQPVPSQAVYYAATSTSGLEWAATTNYPTDIGSSSCGVSGGYVYCVGGETSLGTFTNNVYYAAATSSGVGTWDSTSSYNSGQEGVELLSCGISAGTMVCVGGLA